LIPKPQQLAFCDVADVFRFVNDQCQFLSALTPLQPRYAKQAADADSLMAAIMAQAMNHGNLVIAKTSDIPYHVLEEASQQYLRQASLQAANDRISDAIADLPIFPHYSFDLGVLYGAVDGQKFGVERPTVKARHSRKYFGRGKGVVAYSINGSPFCHGWMRVFGTLIQEGSIGTESGVVLPGIDEGSNLCAAGSRPARVC
jgi:hypothetical protein